MSRSFFRHLPGAEPSVAAAVEAEPAAFSLAVPATVAADVPARGSRLPVSKYEFEDDGRCTTGLVIGPSYTACEWKCTGTVLLMSRS